MIVVLLSAVTKIMRLFKAGVDPSRFWGAVRNCKKRLLPSSCVSVRLSARMEQFDSYWTDSYEVLIFEYISKIFAERIQVTLKHDKKNVFFTLRPVCTFTIISR